MAKSLGLRPRPTASASLNFQTTDLGETVICGNQDCRIPSALGGSQSLPCRCLGCPCHLVSPSQPGLASQVPLKQLLFGNRGRPLLLREEVGLSSWGHFALCPVDLELFPQALRSFGQPLFRAHHLHARLSSLGSEEDDRRELCPWSYCLARGTEGVDRVSGKASLKG